MKTGSQVFLLLVIIAAIVGGTLYFADQKQIFDVSGPLMTYTDQVPFLRDYVSAGIDPPQNEIAELEKLQEEKAREERWSQLKKTETELKNAETLLNEEKQRLAQWESELERREKAIEDRETEFSNREKQYERAVKYYTTMRPADAARILSQQDDILVMEVFRRMPERNVAAILATMDPTVAAAIMRKMAR